jgi:SagB-type dehydrogenase family enzyme
VYPHTSYLILATPRSGSYLLCEGLIRTRLAGNPTEYFGPHQIEAIMKHLGTSSYKECVDWILAQGTTPNGVFGGKLIWNFHEEFVNHLRKSTGYKQLQTHEILDKVFPNLHYVWITRRDKVRQAISYWKALNTRDWLEAEGGPSSGQAMGNQQEPLGSLEKFDAYGLAVTQEATFNYHAIEGLRYRLEQNEAEIQEYLATYGIEPFKVVYEDFVDAYEETALQILDFLQIPRMPAKVELAGERTLKKQANEQSEEWLQRYYQIKQRDRQDIHTVAAQRYIQANVQPPDPREVDWPAKPLPFKLYRNCEQIPLGYGGTGSAQIGQMLVDIYGLTRQSHSIAMFHPMLRYLPQEETGAMPFYTALLRPVPSGGALFPCELYLLVTPSQDLPAGIYHYDAAHHALDILVQGDYTAHLQSALAHPGETPPSYTLLLSSYFWKDGFKYGAFSYRLQGLDIGTVIGQSEIMTQHAGLATTIHYQFQDKVLNDLLGLDPLAESVYAVIEWRPAENKARSQMKGDSHVGTGVSEANNGQPANEKPLSALSDHALPVGMDSVPKIPTPERLAPVPTLPALGTINASTLGSNETLSSPSTESIARWPLSAEVHRASLIETREAFRPLHGLAPIEPLGSEGGKTFALSADMPLDLWEARYQRRSTGGVFLPTPLTKRQLSQLLRTSMCGTTNDLDGHTDFLQHTLLYCIVYRVFGMPPGVYTYQPGRHELELVHAGSMPYELHQALSLSNSLTLFYMSVSLFPVGNYKSGIQVYGDRWYRMQNMEAGIIAQRLYLAAAALKLGCRASLGFSTSEINRHLGLSDANDDAIDDQNTSLMQIMIAPERPAYQHYEQSLLI